MPTKPRETWQSLRNKLFCTKKLKTETIYSFRFLLYNAVAVVKINEFCAIPANIMLGHFFYGAWYIVERKIVQIFNFPQTFISEYRRDGNKIIGQ